MGDLKYSYIDKKIKLIIEEDVVGFYLIVYEEPNSTKSTHDFLLDSLEDAFQEAKEKYGIPKEKWTMGK